MGGQLVERARAAPDVRLGEFPVHVNRSISLGAVDYAFVAMVYARARYE